MSEQLIPVRPPAGKTRQTTKRRDVHFRDELTEKGGLGEDLGVEERRCRLERNDRQFFEPMEPAWRMDVEQRDGEHQTSRPSAQPAPSIFPTARRPPADNVVSVVDGFQQRIKVRLGPGLLGGGQEDQRQVRPLQTTTQ